MPGERDNYDKRGVTTHIPDWPGWSQFLEYLDMAREAKYPGDSKAYFIILFETGCRVSEALELKPEDFSFNENAIIGYTIPVFKKDKEETRNIVIRRDERNPLAEDFIEIIEECDTKYLMPARIPFTRAVIPDQHTTRMTVYNRINEIHPELFPHGLRAYRALHLVYERGFDIQDLMSWFKWDSYEMAAHYTLTRNIARKMGIEEMPTWRQNK